MPQRFPGELAEELAIAHHHFPVHDRKFHFAALETRQIGEIPLFDFAAAGG